jgi:hypothetical protein
MKFISFKSYLFDKIGTTQKINEDDKNKLLTIFLRPDPNDNQLILKFPNGDKFKIMMILSRLAESCTHDFGGEDYNYSFENIFLRHVFTRVISWTIPTYESLNLIKKFVGDGTLYDVGCGTGFWSYLMSHENIKVKAFDTPAIQKLPFLFYDNIDTNCLCCSNILESATDGDTLFLSYPTPTPDTAYAMVNRFNGTKLIYIGNWMKDVATPIFFDLLDNKLTHNKKFNLINKFLIRSWKYTSEVHIYFYEIIISCL